MTKETIYQTPGGTSAKGYIIDGKTYKDPNGNERVEVGSVVTTDGGTFVRTPYGGVPVQSEILGNIREGYAAAGAHLGNALDARKNAINNATRQNIINIENQMDSANQRYADANRSAYSTYLNASNPYGVAEEQRARIGLSDSGFAESSKVQLANAYQTSLGNNLRAKNDYLNELENAKRNAEYAGNIELANAIAEYENLVYKHGIDAAEAIANAEMRAFESGADMIAAAKKEEAQRNETLWQRAYQLARMGFSNADIARALGVSQAELSRVISGV